MTNKKKHAKNVKMGTKKRNLTFLLIPIIFSLINSLGLIYSTKHYQLGVTPDSVSYLEISKRIPCAFSNNTCLNNISTHRPPGYPIVLSVISFFTNLKPIESAKVLNIVLVCIIILVFNQLIDKKNINLLSKIVLNILLLSSSLQNISLMVWSETFFITSLLITILLIKIDTNRKSNLIIVFAGLLSGFMFLIRYAAISFILSFIISLSLIYKKKLKIIMSYCLSSLIVPFCWLLFSKLTSQNPVNRELSIHLISANHFKHFIYTLGWWIFPFPKSQIKIMGIDTAILDKILIPSLLLSIFIFIFVIYYHSKEKIIHAVLIFLNSKYNQALLTHVAIYIFFLITSISFLDFHTPLDTRILSPIQPLLLILLANNIHTYKRYILKSHLLKLIFSLIVLINVSSYFENYRFFYNNGSGYSGKKWMQSSTLSSSNQHLDHTIFTNGTDLLFYKFEIITKPIPNTINPFNQQPNALLQEELEIMINDLIEKENTTLIYFNDIGLRYYQLEKNIVLSNFNENQVTRFDDGFIIQNKK